jgi:hypothetical protein
MEQQGQSSGVGAKRARDAQNDSNSEQKKQKKEGWVDANTQEVRPGARSCNHCRKSVSASKITYRKKHLLSCSAFLDSNEATEAAADNEALRAVVQQHRCVCTTPGTCAVGRPGPRVTSLHPPSPNTNLACCNCSTKQVQP